jgi:hypothetical protein
MILADCRALRGFPPQTPPAGDDCVPHTPSKRDVKLAFSRRKSEKWSLLFFHQPPSQIKEFQVQISFCLGQVGATLSGGLGE